MFDLDIVWISFRSTEWLSEESKTLLHLFFGGYSLRSDFPKVTIEF